MIRNILSPFSSLHVYAFPIRVKLTVVLIAVALGCAAQAPTVIPPSPNAYAFQRYGDIPVSAYTGVPNISVPLYDVKSGDIQVPISLSYHASGIRVADEASKVGLGWILNSGGMISRTIVGADDFTASPLGNPYHSSTVPELGSYSIITAMVQWGCAIFVDNQWIDFQNYDSEPDQYYFSLPNGKSGKFILKRDKTVILEKGDLIDIKMMDTGGTKWQIRTADGFTYEFDISENYFETGYPLHRTAWYLTRIVSPTLGTVSFTYTVTPNNVIQTLGAFTQIQDDGAIQGGCSGEPFYSSQAPGRQYTSVQVESIAFKEGMVKFWYSSREDVQGDSKLDSVVISKKTGSAPTYERLKKVRLEYEYFVGTSDRIPGTRTTYESKRLKLKRVYDVSKTNKNGYNYVFDYNDEESTIPSPSKLSFARDHWGYYNGRDANSTLIPTFTPNYNYDNTPELFQRIWGVMGDERDAGPRYVDLFSLKRIWYPTGGYTDLEMESHDFDEAKSKINDNNPYDTDQLDQTSVSLPTYTGTVHTAFPANFAEALQTGYVLDLREAGSSQVNLNVYFKFNNVRTSCPAGNETVTFRLLGENGQDYGFTNIFQAISATSPNASCSGNPNGSPPNYTPSYDGIVYSNTYDLPPGRYYWQLYIDPNITFFSNVNPTFTYLRHSAGGTDFGGGLRVKRVLSYEATNAVPQVTRYEYGHNDGSGWASDGRRMVFPNYSYVERANSCEFVKRGSDCTVPLSRSGSAVAYDQVTVYYGENGENGKTTFVYHNQPEFMLGYIQLGLPRRAPANPTIPDQMNGMLMAQYDFRYVSPSVFDTVRTIRNTYTNLFPSTNSTIWAVERRTVAMPDGDQCSHYMQFIYPAIQQTWINLTSSKEKTFDQFDQTKTSTVMTNYYYDNPNHFQLTREEKSWDGKKITTRLKYPLDYTDAECSAPVLAMKNRTFMNSPVIEKRTEEQIGSNQNVISQEITRYDYFNGNTMILPSLAANFKLSKPEALANVPAFVPSAAIDTTKYKTNYKLTYDAGGQITSVRKPNDIFTSYVWGYQGTVPIAESKNALPAQIFYTSFEDFGEGDSNLNDSKTGVRSRTSGFTKSLTNLTTGTYTLTYWSKSGGIWSPQSQDVSVAGTTYTISLSGQVDEIRFGPKGSPMTTYTYEPMVGIQHVMDPSGSLTRFEYDVFGRLRLVKDSDGNVVKQYSYNFKLK